MWSCATDAPPEGFGVGSHSLVHLLQNRVIGDLEQLGGVSLVLKWPAWSSLCACFFVFFSLITFKQVMKMTSILQVSNFLLKWLFVKQVAGLEKSLHTNLEQGIKDEPEEIEKRKAAYGANTYPKKKPKGILVCYGNCCWILLITIHHF